MEAYEIVENLEAIWKEVPENTIRSGHIGRKSGFEVFFSTASLRVYVRLLVGPQGGISEHVFVFDPSMHIVSDRLLANCFDGDEFGTGAIFPLKKLRQKVIRDAPRGMRKEFALEVCETAMQAFLSELNIHPPTPEKLRSIESTSQSIPWRLLIQGGTPSLGRFGGGAPGQH